MGQMGGMTPAGSSAEGNNVPAAFRKKGAVADNSQSSLPPGLAALEATSVPISPMMPAMVGYPPMVMGGSMNPMMPGANGFAVPGFGMPGVGPGFIPGPVPGPPGGAFGNANSGMLLGANFPVGMYENSAASAVPTSGVMQSGVMQTMMEQQVQFQQMLMDEELMNQMQEQKLQEQRPPSGPARPRKDLPMPPPLQARPDYVKMLHEFMDKFDFDDRHKLRLIAAVGNRVDMFVEDIETLHMIMQAGSNPKNPGAFLVSCVKRMEDGTFQHRDPATRAAWRRKQEGNKEAEENEDDESMPTANVKQLVRTTGSIRKAHEAQQKRFAAEMAKAKEEEEKGNRSRSRGRGNRRKSRSTSRRRRR